MKKLGKNLNLKKDNIEAYNVYYSCDCKNTCGGEAIVSVRNRKEMHVMNNM